MIHVRLLCGIIVTPLPLFGGGYLYVKSWWAVGRGGFSVSPHFHKFQLLMLIIYTWYGMQSVAMHVHSCYIS